VRKPLKFMAWKKNAPKTVVLFLALIVLAVVIKLIFFSGGKDDYFAMNIRGLRQVPAGPLVLRPTRYPFVRSQGALYATPTHHGGADWRMMVRNAPLRDIIAAAYDVGPGRVILPANAPRRNYDRLVTVPKNQQERLQGVVRRQLRYVAKKETRETDVLALTVVNRNPPNLAVSEDHENRHGDFNDLKITLKHFPLGIVADDRLLKVTEGLATFLKIPVVGKTDLTNMYDYSMAYDTPTRRQLQNEVTARPVVDQILAGWGLIHKPDRASMEMLIVSTTP